MKKSLIVPMKGKGVHCHRMIADLSKEMAASIYEELAKNDKFYAMHPSQTDYVTASWHLYILRARATLAEMLTTSLDESLKEQIADALIKDNSLQRGRQHMTQVGSW